MKLNIREKTQKLKLRGKITSSKENNIIQRQKGETTPFKKKTKRGNFILKTEGKTSDCS